MYELQGETVATVHVGRQTDRERDRQRETQTDRQTDRERDTDRERQRQRETQTDRQTRRDTDRQTGRERNLFVKSKKLSDQSFFFYRDRITFLSGACPTDVKEWKSESRSCEGYTTI